MKTAPVAVNFAVLDCSQWPRILTINEIALIYRLSVATIRKYLQIGTFSPAPWDRYPYRWRREDVIADLQRKRDGGPIRNHGFRMRKALLTKAAAGRSRS